MALQEPHILESVQRPVERSIPNKQLFLSVVRELFRQLVSMEFVRSASSQVRGGDANRFLQRDEC